MLIQIIMKQEWFSTTILSGSFLILSGPFPPRSATVRGLCRLSCSPCSTGIRVLAGSDLQLKVGSFCRGTETDQVRAPVTLRRPFGPSLGEEHESSVFSKLCKCSI